MKVFVVKGGKDYKIVPNLKSSTGKDCVLSDYAGHSEAIVRELLVGVMSSLSAALILYFGRFQLVAALNFIFRRHFPNIAGKYLWTLHHGKNGGEDAYPRQKIYLYLRQTANQVTGHCEVFSGEELKRKYSVDGTISPTRVLRINFESETTEHHDLGVGLSKLDSDSRTLKGYTSMLCVRCESTSSTPTSLQKIA